GGAARGRETHAGGGPGSWRGRYEKSAAAAADNETVSGTAARQIHRLLFFPRGHRPLSRERTPPARHAGWKRPAAAGAHPDARIAAPAGDVAAAGRGTPGTGPDHRIDRLRQELDTRGADRTHQH